VSRAFLPGERFRKYSDIFSAEELKRAAAAAPRLFSSSMAGAAPPPVVGGVVAAAAGVPEGLVAGCPPRALAAVVKGAGETIMGWEMWWC